MTFLQRQLIGLLLFFFFLLEGTWLQWLIPPEWQSRIVVVPHLVLTAVLLIGIYVNRYQALVYGFAFGMLHDIVYYGPMLGVYALTMGIVGYGVGLAASRSTHNVLTGLFFVAVGHLLFEWILYGIYKVFQVTHLDVQRAFLDQMLPSILINLLLTLILYVPFRKLLERVKASAQREEPE